MKESQLLGILALMLALGIPLPIDLFCPATEGVDSVAQKVSTEAELIAAIQDEQISRVILQNDIVTVANLEITRDLTLDLGGFNLTSVRPEIRVIDLKYGNLTITGRGGIVAYGSGGAAVRIRGATTADNANYAKLTIDPEVRLYAPHFYGLFLAPNFNSAYGVTIDFRGTMIAHDGICINGNITGRGENAPHIQIADTAKITVDENEGIALYAAGYGIWRIGAADITGAIGLSVKSGIIQLDNTRIIATGAMSDPATWSEQMTSGAAIQIEHPLPNLRAEVTASGGDYTSVQSYVITQSPTNQNSLQAISLEAGNFMGRLGVFYGVAPREAETSMTRVLGGLYNADVTDFLAPNRHLEKRRQQGVYNVIDDTEKEIVLDEATLVADARIQLGILLEESEYYITGKYVSGELGDWQPRLAKLLTSAKRAKTIAKKALRSSNELDKLTSAARSLERAVENIRLLGDELRTELASAVASVEAIDPRDYSDYSYQEVTTVRQTATDLLAKDDPTLEDMYSALLDIEINIDLLESRETEMEETVETLLMAPVTSAVSHLASPPPPPTPPADLVVPPPKPQPEPESVPEIEPEVLSIAESFTVSEMLRLAEHLDDESSEPAEDPFVDGAMELLATALLSEPILPPDPELPAANPITVVDNQAFKTAEQTLRQLLNAISSLDPDDYTASSYAVLANAATGAGNLLLDRANLTTELLTSTFDNVKLVYDNLVKKTNYPTLAALEEAKNNLRSMLEAVRYLSVNDYELDSAEQFGELQVAIAKATAILTKSSAVLTDIVNVMDEINHATSGLKIANPQPRLQTAPPSSPQSDPQPQIHPRVQSQARPQPRPQERPQTSVQAVSSASILNWSDLREVVSDISKLTPDNYTTQSYAKLLAELERAKALLANPKATQNIIDDLVFDLNLALLALEPATPSQNYATSISNATSSAVQAPTSISQPIPAASTFDQPTLGDSSDPAITPSFLMSMMAGAYAGIATYRKSRLEAKRRKHFSV